MTAPQIYCAHCGAACDSTLITCFSCRSPLKKAAEWSASVHTLLAGRYLLLECVGQGGFGSVYKALDRLENRRLVAIKTISLGGLSAQRLIEATDSFNREVMTLEGLSHPHLPRLYHHFTDAEHWYLVMDFIEGVTLETYLHTRQEQYQLDEGQTRRLPLDEVLDMALQLCDVLDYLHTRQPTIIFRDLKPSNIMRTANGRLYLIDFGIARRFRPGQPRDTQALGSPGYAAPEQYGRAQTTPRSDIYSLGALLHFLLSGNDPAEASPGLKPLSLHIEQGEEALSDLVQRMLSPDPEQRPATVHDVIAVLEHIQRQRTAQPAARVWQPPEPQNLPSSPEKWQQLQRQVLASPSTLERPAFEKPTSFRDCAGLAIAGFILSLLSPSLVLLYGLSPVQSTLSMILSPLMAYALWGGLLLLPPIFGVLFSLLGLQSTTRKGLAIAGLIVSICSVLLFFLPLAFICC